MTELSLGARIRRFYATKELGWTFTNRDLAHEMGIPTTAGNLGSIASANTTLLRAGYLTAVRQAITQDKQTRIKYTYTLVKYPELTDTPARESAKRETGLKRHQQDFLAGIAPLTETGTLSSRLFALSVLAEQLEGAKTLADATVDELLEELRKRYDLG